MQPIPKRLFTVLVAMTVLLFGFIVVFHLPSIFYIALALAALPLLLARFTGKVV